MSPEKILHKLLTKATKGDYCRLSASDDILEKINYVCRCVENRAGVRLLMACLLAKICEPDVDPLKPYTEIGSDDCFSGRTYDEKYITNFINENNLPCNPTTAFLTPALRNLDSPLSPNVEIIGRPRRVYHDTIVLLQLVHDRNLQAKALLTEVIKMLVKFRDEKGNALKEHLTALSKRSCDIVLSSEEIVNLIQQHLACKHSSRLPVLIVAAAYAAAKDRIGEHARPLLSHTAADEQTGSIGDVEVCLVGDNNVKTAYEMKMRRVSRGDIDRAIQKIANSGETVDNYIFITTEKIDYNVAEYAKSMYYKLGQREIAIVDCVGFLRHYLHLFHRLRKRFLDEYQSLLLAEPESAVRESLKKAFLVLREVAESVGDE